VVSARIRHLYDETFGLSGDNEIYVSNKYVILSGPEQWLAPVSLASLAKAMREADTEATRRLFVSTDTPDRFDPRYPGHLLDIHLELSHDPRRLRIAVGFERPDEEDDQDIQDELSKLLRSLVARHRGSSVQVTRAERILGWFIATFDVPTRGRTVGDALAIGREVEALIHAASGGHLSLESAVDLVRTGRAAALVGVQEGPWLDGKRSPYRLEIESQRWELAKDVASFANSETGGLIVTGARTTSSRDGDMVQSVTEFELNLMVPGRYRRILAARIHPRVEGLEVGTVASSGTRGVGYIFIPPQREELKPFVVSGMVVSGEVRGTHVCIPVRDGEDTRYAEGTEIHALLQAGRAALQRPLDR
jgi:hypothetical protein